MDAVFCCELSSYDFTELSAHRPVLDDKIPAFKPCGDIFPVKNYCATKSG